MEINEKKHKKEQQELIIRKYQQYLKLEKSLSLNTLDAYLTDLDKLMSFLTLEGIYVLDVCLSDLQRFAAGLHDIGIHPRSQARILSGIKSFFRFLILENYLEADPSELLEGPKIGFKLPEVLTVEEIDRIISAVDRSKAEGQRNRAILETLYSCGCSCKLLGIIQVQNLAVFRKDYRSCYYRTCQRTSAHFINSAQIPQIFILMFINFHLFCAQFLRFQSCFFFMALFYQFLHTRPRVFLVSVSEFLVFDDIQPGKFFLYLTDGFHFHFSSFSAAGHSRVILPILPERKSSNNTRAALA